jgi:DNA-binding XRE family transcriptional regulator
MRIAYEMHGPDKVLIDLADFEDMMDAIAASEAQARGEEAFPLAVWNRIDAGESPIRVLREHRGMALPDLARAAGVPENTLEALEADMAGADPDALTRVARALNAQGVLESL